jgi:hypothetical protein
MRLKMKEFNQEIQLGTLSNPVRCDGVIGEFEYLENLVTPDGEPIKYYREGSFPYGEGAILDKYIIQDESGNVLTTIYFDMYHPKHRETRIVSGLRHAKQFNERQPYQHIDYLFQRLGELNLEKIDLQSQFVYVWSKAGMLLSKGAYIYALDDAFGFPIETMDVKQLKLNCGQIVHELASAHSTHPLKVNDQKDVVDLLRTFHFEIVKISAHDKQFGVYIAEGAHLVTHDKITFYFNLND